MRATIFEEPGKVSVQDRPTPDAGPGEVRFGRLRPTCVDVDLTEPCERREIVGPEA